MNLQEKIFEIYVKRNEPYKLVQEYLDLIKSEINTNKSSAKNDSRLSTLSWCKERLNQQENFIIDDNFAKKLSSLSLSNSITDKTYLEDFFVNLQSNFIKQVDLLTKEIENHLPPADEIKRRKQEMYIELFKEIQRYKYWVYFRDGKQSEDNIVINQLLTLKIYLQDETAWDSNLFSFQLEITPGKYMQILLHISDEYLFGAYGINNQIQTYWVESTAEELLNKIMMERKFSSPQYLNNFQTQHITI